MSAFEDFQIFGPLRTENEKKEKLFAICRNLFPQLSKRDLRNCFKNSEILIDNEAVRGSEDEVRRLKAGSTYEIKIIRNIEYYKRKQMEALNIQICHQKQNLLLVAYKPSGINGSIGRLYDEALLYSYSLSTSNKESAKKAETSESPKERLYAIYRLSKSIGGLCLYGTTLSSYQLLRKLLCLNLCQLSFVCIVVGDVQQTATGTTIPLPVCFGECVEDKLGKGDDAADDDDDGNLPEKDCVMHSLRIEVLQVSSGHHIGSLSLLRVTPSFLEEYSKRKMETLLKPTTPSDYQYLHYPVSVIKAIPKALRLAGLCLIGGDRGLVKASKGLYFFLDQIRFSSSEKIRERMITGEDFSSDWEGINGDFVSVPMPERFTKLLSHRSRGEEPGEKEVVTFHGLPFQISSDVMTPRPASETLVRQALLIARQRSATAGAALPPLRLLDLGTGSGSLLLACLHSLQQEGIPCYGVGIDICYKALHIAQRNATLLSLDHHTTFLQHSFTDLPALQHRCHLQSGSSSDDFFPPFDIVLCNPPYSSLKEDRVSHSRRLHEPAIALFADAAASPLIHSNDPAQHLPQLPVFHSLSSHESLIAFRGISSSLRQLLASPALPSGRPLLGPDCAMLIEFGNGQLDDVAKIFSGDLSALAPVTGIFSDHDGFPRCLRLTVA
jgi:methylase of polypeptide subunit release factors/23S rRNA-/tRNA-specific pseudouridylate synthase